MLILALTGLLEASKYAAANAVTKTSASTFVHDAIILAKKHSHESYYDDGRLASDIELALREELGSLIKPPYISGNHKNNKNKSHMKDSDHVNNVLQLVNFSALIAIETVGTPLESVKSIRKVPYLLLEDYLDGQPVTCLATLWDVLMTPLTPLLTSEVLFMYGKTLLLRLCNSLLRRLSRVCDTEVCGRIKMFLAASFPINERSAINLTGRHNTDNITMYEKDSDSYTLSAKAATGDVADVSGDDADVTGNDADINTHNSYSMKPSSLSKDPMFRFRLDRDDMKDSLAESKRPVIHDDYLSFWTLQDLMVIDQKSNDSLRLIDCCKNALTLIESIENDIISEACVTHSVTRLTSMKAAEKAPLLNEHRQDTAKSSTINDRAIDNKTANYYRSVKYLTSADLLPLELRDPAFRQQIAAQVLFACQSLRIHQRNLAKEYTTKVSVDDKERKNNKKFDVSDTMKVDNDTNKDKSEKVTEIGDSYKDPIEVERWIAGQLRLVEDRSFDIIEAEPLGKITAANLRRILLSELFWAEWKIEQCPSFSKEAIAISQDIFIIAAKKLKNTDEIPIDTLKSAVERICSYNFPKVSDAFKEKLEYLEATIPSFDSYLQDYIDADDPECGIEDEYHPRHNGIYCWSARRLLLKSHLSAFSSMSDGDLGKGLKSMNEHPTVITPHSWIEIKHPLPIAPIAKELDISLTLLPDQTKDIMDEEKVLEEKNINVSEMDVIDSTAHEDAEVSIELTEVSSAPALNEVNNEDGNDTNEQLWLRVMEYKQLETEEGMKTYFSEFGDVVSVRLIKAVKGQNTKPKHALVKFAGSIAEQNVVIGQITNKKHTLNGANILCDTYSTQNINERNEQQSTTRKRSRSPCDEFNMDSNEDAGFDMGAGSGKMHSGNQRQSKNRKKR